MAAIADGSSMPADMAHKLPAGDGLYVRAKRAQLVEKNPEKAVSLFRASLDAGDRVDSALKDLAVVLKQLNRPEDAILAISAFRSRCSESAQDSLDNLLLDLYKSSGRLDDQIALLVRKLKAFERNRSFNGKRTKTARSQGKKFQVSVEQEVARLLGNLGWAYMQQLNYKDAESSYRQALALEVDSNKVCNLVVSLLKQGRMEEAISMLQEAFAINKKGVKLDCHLYSYGQAQDLLDQAECTPSSRKRSAVAANLLQAGLTSKTRCRQHPRARYDRRHGTNLSPSYKLSELTGVHVNASRAAINGSEMMLARNKDHRNGGKSIRDEGIDNQASNNEGVILSDDEGAVLSVEDGSHFPMPTSSSQAVHLNILPTRAMQRLPVFQDITSLESVTA